jgi:hypothetical protein
MRWPRRSRGSSSSRRHDRPIQVSTSSKAAKTKQRFQAIVARNQGCKLEMS